jgi:hypothetical protein
VGSIILFWWPLLWIIQSILEHCEQHPTCFTSGASTHAGTVDRDASRGGAAGRAPSLSPALSA